MVLASVLMIAIILILIGLGLVAAASSQYRITADNVYRQNALLAAEAGVEQSVEQLNQDENFTGYPSPQTFFTDSDQGRGTFVTTISPSPDNTNAKIIESTGYAYYQRANSPIVGKRSIKVTVVGTSSGNYAVHTGPGGLILSGSANITNSDVYVNGTITMTGAAKIGTPGQPLNVFAANIACPTGASPGPTYPQLCTGGQQPISLGQSTNIYGTVCATGQTSTGPNNNIQPGSTGQGLVAGCTAPSVSTPTYDRAAHIARVTTTASGTSNTYTCQNWPFTRTWPANLSLTGSVSIASSCDVTINGDAYITGNLTIGGAAKIRVSDSVGTTRPVVIVDGTISVGGSGSIIPNSYGTGVQFISFKSSASCSPACTSLSGNDLKASQSLLTVDVSGAVNLPGVIFQSYWGRVKLAGSGNVGSAIGQTVDLSGAGTVIFGTGLSSGARTWSITSYQQTFQ